jgi:hypothetical protein
MTLGAGLAGENRAAKRDAFAAGASAGGAAGLTVAAGFFAAATALATAGLSARTLA